MPSNSNDKHKRKFIGFAYAWNGLVEVTKNERNFRIHLLATVLVILVGLIVKLSLFEWMIAFLAIGMVLVAETINTAVEKLIDYLKPDIHPAAKVIKDISAGSVLVAAITAFIIGCLLFVPKLYKMLLF